MHATPSLHVSAPMQQQHGHLKGSRMTQTIMPITLMMRMKGMHRHATRHLRSGGEGGNIDSNVAVRGTGEGVTRKVSIK